ncbi:hypothetical protein MTO96_019864 [Rhipicephalus appendiculatus]
MHRAGLECALGERARLEWTPWRRQPIETGGKLRSAPKQETVARLRWGRNPREAVSRPKVGSAVRTINRGERCSSAASCPHRRR